MATPDTPEVDPEVIPMIDRGEGEVVVIQPSGAEDVAAAPPAAASDGHPPSPTITPQQKEEGDFDRIVFGSYSCCLGPCVHRGTGGIHAEEVKLFGPLSWRDRFCFWLNELWNMLINAPCLMADCFCVLLFVVLGKFGVAFRDQFLTSSKKWEPYLSAEADLIDDYGYHEDISLFGDGNDIVNDETVRKEYEQKIREKIETRETKEGECLPDAIAKELMYVSKKNFVQRFLVLQKVVGNESIAKICDPAKLTPLQIAMWNRSRDVAQLLLETKQVEMIMKTVEHKDYRGSTCLHMAIVQKDMDLVRKCMDSLPDSFNRQLMMHTELTGKDMMKYIQSARSPLALAVWTGNPEIVKYLIDKGADLDYVDTDGYTAVHCTVMMSIDRPNEASEMYDILMNSAAAWWRRSSKATGPFVSMESRVHLLSQRTLDNLNALGLAVRCGSRTIVEKILNTEHVYKFTVARFGPTDVAYYNVSDLDPVLTQYRDAPSVIEMLVTSENDKTLQCLEVPLIDHILDKKWASYFMYYVIIAVCYFVYMIVMSCNLSTVTVEARNESQFSNISLQSYITRSEFSLLDILCVFGASVMLMSGIAGLWSIIKFLRRRKGGARKYLNFWRRMALFVMMIAYAANVYLWMVLRLAVDPLQNIFLMIAVLVGWSFMLFFMQAFRQTAFFALMVERLLVRDLLVFTITYMFVTLAFASAFVANMEYTVVPAEGFSDLGDAMFTLFRLMLGLVEVDDLLNRDKYSYSTYGINVTLFIGYVTMTTILLLNMLIASMTNTYTELTEHPELLWKKVRSYNIHLIEQTLPGILQLFSTARLTKLYKIQRKDGSHIWRKVYLCKL